MQLDNPIIYFVKLYTTIAAAAFPASPFPAAARRGAASRQVVGLCGDLTCRRSRIPAAGLPPLLSPSRPFQNPKTPKPQNPMIFRTSFGLFFGN